MDVFPLRLFDRAGAPKLEQAVKRAQREGDEAEQAAGVEACGEIDGSRRKIHITIAGEGDGGCRALEIAGAKDSFADIEGAEGMARTLEAGAFVVEDGRNDPRKRHEDGDGEKFRVLQGDQAFAIHRFYVSAGDREIDATGEQAAAFHFETVGGGEAGHREF